MKISNEAKRAAGAILKVARVEGKSPSWDGLAAEIERHTGILALNETVANLRIERESLMCENAELRKQLGMKKAA